MVQRGILTLRKEGVLMATEGKTSLEEALSVTHSEESGSPSDKPQANTEVRDVA